MTDIQTVLFVCDAKDWEEARACIDRLRNMKKTVNTAIYSPNSKDVPTWYSNYLLLRGDSDVTLWGFPDKHLEQQFCALPADLLLDLSGIQTDPMYYMILKHPSEFKAGIKREGKEEYDMAIVPPEEESGAIKLTKYFDIIIKYLQTIGSK